MKTQNNNLDFTGYKLYIGIDVHLNQWTVTIRMRDLELKTFSMNPSPQQLKEHLMKYYPHAQFYSVYEAGFCGFWAHRELCKLGINNMVVNPADVPTTHKEKTQKRDSRKLARADLPQINIRNTQYILKLSVYYMLFVDTKDL